MLYLHVVPIFRAFLSKSYKHFFLFMCATCPAHLIMLRCRMHLITSFAMKLPATTSYPHPLLVQNISPSTPFSDPLYLYASTWRQRSSFISIQNYRKQPQNEDISQVYSVVGLGQVRLGQVTLDQVRLGQVRLGQATLGQVRLGQVRLRQATLGQVRLGQVRLGQVTLGYVRLGQARLGQTFQNTNLVHNSFNI